MAKFTTATKGGGTHKEGSNQLQIPHLDPQQTLDQEQSQIQENTHSRDINTSTNNTNYIHMVVPCTKGLSKSVKNICDRVGIHINFTVGQLHQKSHSGM